MRYIERSAAQRVHQPDVQRVDEVITVTPEHGMGLLVDHKHNVARDTARPLIACRKARSIGRRDKSGVARRLCSSCTLPVCPFHCPFHCTTQTMITKNASLGKIKGAKQQAKQAQCPQPTSKPRSHSLPFSGNVMRVPFFQPGLTSISNISLTGRP